MTEGFDRLKDDMKKVQSNIRGMNFAQFKPMLAELQTKLAEGSN